MQANSTNFSTTDPSAEKANTKICGNWAESRPLLRHFILAPHICFVHSAIPSESLEQASLYSERKKYAAHRNNQVYYVDYPWIGTRVHSDWLLTNRLSGDIL